MTPTEQIIARPPAALDKLRLTPFLAPYAVYVLHTLEEIQGFAAWATRHFGPETTGAFAGYHIPLMLLVGLCSWQAVRSGGRRGWVVAATACQLQFGVNALFHLTTWVIFEEYSPGAVTAAVVSIPVTVFYFRWLQREQHLPRYHTISAILIGTLIAALAIGFLFL